MPDALVGVKARVKPTGGGWREKLFHKFIKLPIISVCGLIL
jgi:hypothetical protein